MAEKITKSDWQSSFLLVGKPVITAYTYKIDQKSEKSNWVYNSLNLMVDCGERHGAITAEMMGGYSEDNQNVIYCHGKDENDKDDFQKKITVVWEDRFNPEILEEIGSNCFITVGLEKTTKGEIFRKRFLSAYDAIAYVNEHLTSDMVVAVGGDLKYSDYQDNTQTRKVINRITLIRDENPTFSATFKQSILIDKDSASLKNIDKAKGVMYVDAKVLDYIKEKNGVEIRGQYPFNKTFEYGMDFTNEMLCKKIYDKLFKVKKGYTQATFEGEFIESGATVNMTLDDCPDEIKELVELGIYTEEDAIAACATNGSRERRMVLKKPVIKKVGEGDNQTSVVQIFEERYMDEDLYIDLGNAEEDSEEDVPFDPDTAVTGDSELDWLNQL